MKYTVTVAFDVPFELTLEVIARSRERAEQIALIECAQQLQQAKPIWAGIDNYRVIDIERTKDLMAGEKP